MTGGPEQLGREAVLGQLLASVQHLSDAMADQRADLKEAITALRADLHAATTDIGARLDRAVTLDVYAADRRAAEERDQQTRQLISDLAKALAELQRTHDADIQRINEQRGTDMQRLEQQRTADLTGLAQQRETDRAQEEERQISGRRFVLGIVWTALLAAIGALAVAFVIHATGI